MSLIILFVIIAITYLEIFAKIGNKLFGGGSKDNEVSREYERRYHERAAEAARRKAEREIEEEIRKIKKTKGE